MMFLRPDERPSKDAGPQPGVLVTFSNGVKHFFPGPSPELCLALVDLSPAAEMAYSKGAKIEWGAARGRSFAPELLISGG